MVGVLRRTLRRAAVLAVLPAAAMAAGPNEAGPDVDAGLNPGDTPHLELLDSSQMGLALGIENVIHAALTKGGAAQAAVQRAERLARYIAN